MLGYKPIKKDLYLIKQWVKNPSIFGWNNPTYVNPTVVFVHFWPHAGLK